MKPLARIRLRLRGTSSHTAKRRASQPCKASRAQLAGNASWPQPVSKAPRARAVLGLLGRAKSHGVAGDCSGDCSATREGRMGDRASAAGSSASLSFSMSTSLSARFSRRTWKVVAKLEAGA